VRPVTHESGRAALGKARGREYTTDISIEKDGGVYRSICTVSAGFRHQVRCHLAWVLFPVCGDALYNPRYVPGETMAFTASGLFFRHPVSGEEMRVRLP
jgi:23S rRNA pseudouridine1911/1915/1917 synthase